MNICVTVNSKYMRYLYVMLLSLFETNKDSVGCLYVLERDFSDADKSTIRELCERFGWHVDFIHIDESRFAAIQQHFDEGTTLSPDIYSRLFIPDVLPVSIDRVLMLDVDLVILGSLKELYNVDFDGRYFAAAPNMCHNGVVPVEWRKWYPSGRTNWTHYNTGILLWNLKKWRSDFSQGHLLDLAIHSKIGEQTFEEELFNVWFGEDKILSVPAEKWDYITTHEQTFAHPNFYVYQNNEELKEKCRILHFAARNPWQAGVKNEKYHLWWDVAAKTPFYTEFLQESYEQAERLIARTIDDPLALPEKERWCKDMDYQTFCDYYARAKSLMHKDIVIWGASVRGKFLLQLLDRLDLAKNVRAFVDNDPKKVGSAVSVGAYHIPVSTPDILWELRGKGLVLCIASVYLKDIHRELIRRNIRIETYDFPENVACQDLADAALAYKDKEKYLCDVGGDSKLALYFELHHFPLAGHHSLEQILKCLEKERKEFQKTSVLILLSPLHLVAERDLRCRGFVPNRDYLVLSHLYETSYGYAKTGDGEESSDVGTIGPKHLSEYFCPIPFEQLYYYNYSASICSPTWTHEVSVGNPHDVSSIEELWNSERAQQVRASILSGDFTYCNEKICWRMLEGRLLKRSEITNPKYRAIINQKKTVIEGGPEFLNVGYNIACNLHCRMCREEVHAEPEEGCVERSQRQLKSYDFRNLKRLILPGAGEFFLSPDHISMLEHIDEYHMPNLEAIWIYTNGLLYSDEKWDKIKNLAKRYKVKVFISMDAATPETYSLIRHGNFELLLKNVKRLIEKRDAGEITEIWLPFCVQRLNFREMTDFVELAHSLGADWVHFEKLFHSTVSECVHNPNNVYFGEFIKELHCAVNKGQELGIRIDVKPFKPLLSE